MITLDNFTKYDILYRNYVKQFSKAYIKGSNIYVGESLKKCDNIYKCLYVQNFINIYKNIFINLYMTDNKVFDEISEENLCIICLEDLNENIMEVCHKCNVKCHIQCLYDWYRRNNQTEICPICLKTEQYYLDLLNNVTNENNLFTNNRIQPYTEIDDENINNERRNNNELLEIRNNENNRIRRIPSNNQVMIDNMPIYIRVRYFYTGVFCLICFGIFLISIISSYN